VNGKLIIENQHLVNQPSVINGNRWQMGPLNKKTLTLGKVWLKGTGKRVAKIAKNSQQARRRRRDKIARIGIGKR
jgi:hypothetical protein